ncbi:MAG: DUF881 domain-containing protein [Sporichthyaceae bacterium]
MDTASPAAAGASRWRVGVPLVLVVAGMLFAITATTARGTSLRSGENVRLVDLIQAAEARNDRIRLTGERLAAEVESLAAQAVDPRVTQLRAEAAAIAGPAGLTPLSGPGLTVTLDDAPPGALDADYPGLPTPTPDDLVVHQQDLQAVVNAMWAGGAEAIQLMDQRIVATSAVRCVGNVLILQDRVYSPPYAVTAIGDVARMSAALDAAAAISNYREYVDAYGLRYEVKTQRRVTVPAFTGSLDLRYADADE